ncbi:error-prone DNA polymerase [Roseibacillus ishigakijimensis]|uniref:DNA polymerase III subunit alpha n=1 Tax=Roseibacillus ishigakijimensis TaxID=454146 RepID=UPI0027DC9599|nr:error-prone DNA polymerase [Roseibacillus ishigakijimensis]
MPPFIEHLACSAFSFLRGGSHPEALFARAADLGQPGLALPDHLGFYGSARAHQAAKEYGLRAHVGATLELSPPHPAGHSPHPHPQTLACLCPSHHSYRNLSRLLTDHHLSQTLLREDLDLARERVNGLIALTGQPGTPLHHHLLSGDLSSAKTHLRRLLTLFGNDHLYLALTRHHTRQDALLDRSLRELSSHFHLPLLISNAPLYATRPDKLLADVFTCLRHHTTLDQAGTLLGPNNERHLKSTADMRELFPDHPEALAETARLHERLEFSLDNLGYRFPSLLPEHRDDPGAAHALLTRLCHEGLPRRYPAPQRTLRKKARAQLAKELALIRQLRFSGYFLIVHDLITFAQSQGILCQGRGSAANSVVCYLLGLTAVDPIGSGLLFERFLSENRKSWPDIDIDFPSGDRREAVIQYVYQKYAPRGAAMTANVITYRARSAFREVAKVLGFSEETANRFSDIHASPRASNPGEEVPGNNIAEKTPPEVFIAEAGVPTDHPRFPALCYLFERLLSYPRHLGQHSGGMIICDEGLDAIVPLQPAAMPGRTIVQWDKDDCEDLGIVKIDLLGLGMLAAMEDTLRLCHQRGKEIDLAHIPKDDPATYDLMGAADTIGTFQVESRAQMNTLPILRPRCFYDVAIEVAIIRPGPIVGELAHPYLNRRQGLEKVDCIHPLFEPVLRRTLGVPLFQEQVLRMAMLIADFSGTEADELRRAMAFKRSDDKMQAVTAKLRRNMAARGVSPEVADKVVNAIGSFALYGFPESHAISFALIAYASCWLKVHHPAEFYAGLINNQPMGFYNVNTLLQDARRHGIASHPPCVVRSACGTIIEEEGEKRKTKNLKTKNLKTRELEIEEKGVRDSLRLGLHRLKGLSQATAERIITRREEQPFASLTDFLQRARPNKKERRLLAESGALNALPGVRHRRHALWLVERPLQLELFATLPEEETGHEVLAQMTDWEKMATDFATQHQTTGPHPLHLWRKELPPEAKGHLVTACELENLPHGSYLQIAGMVICRQRPQTAKGHCFISLEDETGIANIFVPRRTFEHHRLTLTTEPFLLFEGAVQIGEGGVASVYTHDLRPLTLPQTLEVKSHDFH